MKRERIVQPPLEVQKPVEVDEELLQQEVTGSTPYHFDLPRRDFFKLLGGGVVVGVAIRRGVAQETGGGQRRGGFGEQMPEDVSMWIHVSEQGAVTVFTGKIEVGQNARTSLTQQVAEELRVAPDTIMLVMGDTDLTPYDAGTFGSRTTPQMGTQLRKMSAAAREMLVDIAAKQWGVDAAKLVAKNGAVRNPSSSQTATYGDLTKGQQLVKVLGDDPPTMTPPAEWTVAGTSLLKVDGRDFVTGKHAYTADMQRPGMLYGKVLRPPAFRSNLVSLDDSAVKEMPGVTIVRDGNFVGVTAPDLPTAERAVKALKSQWQTDPQISESEMFSYLKTHSEAGGRGGEFHSGDVEKGRATGDKTVQATYTIDYIQHAPLEPRAAVAEWNGGKLTVWTGSQRPFGVKDELMQLLRLPADKVRVMIPDTGSAYGGKHQGDAAVEAARLAKAAGKPVKLVWTREEEFTWAYFRPSGVIDVRGAVKKDGTVTAWEFDNYNSGPAAIRPWYGFANQRVEYHGTQAPPLRQGSYRGLAATANFFARECHMDDLAHEIGMDPLAFRLKNITDERLKAVFEQGAERFGWGKEKNTPERGFGMGGGFEKGAYLATFAEVAIDGAGEVHVRRVVVAWDSGPVINPNGLKNQIEGAVVQGIGGALFEAIHFDKGQIANPHFADYRVPRFSDTPQIDVVLIDRKDKQPMGAGETGIMGIAPAIGNAIFAATGKRLRTLPMAPQGMKSSS